ncbi:MAG: alpha/beta fold hydrolase [Gemmatimonadaceae bacterium]|nr:alpha/beta fold hydrolase [Gloeobacterales cyanobacterium ES-bin-141]
MSALLFARRLNPVLTIGALLVLTYAIACTVLWSNQRQFIFAPERLIQKTPATYNLTYQNVYLPVQGRGAMTEWMHGWWIPGPRENADVLLYLHGNGINIGANVEHASRMQELGFSVLLVDYRGYGHSGGEFPSETQIYTDAQAIWHYLIYQRQVKPEHIFIYGHSLGGAVAIDLAVKHPEAAGLIVDSSFTALQEVVRLSNKFWMFPVDLLLNQHFDSIDKVRWLRMPVLFIHGMADDLIPFQMSERLFAAASSPKRLALIPGGGHINSAEIDGPRYRAAIRTLVDQVYLRS